jgi:hypothetical protein
MGVIAGAATACCAPVLAGAVAIAGVSGSWWVGAVLGSFYLFGLVSPLLLSAFGIGRIRRHLRDPALTLRLAGSRMHTTLSRLAGGVMFLGLGAMVIALALTGNARNAPGFQKTLGRWLNTWATVITRNVPIAAGWAVVVALAAGVIYLSVRAIRHPLIPATDEGAPPGRACCSPHRTEPEGSNLQGAHH